MIVVDSSALVAIFLKEPEHQAFRDIVTGEERCIMSAVNAHEAATVIRLRSGADGVEDLWQLPNECDPYRHAGRRPGIHVFAARSNERRGCRGQAPT